MKIIQRSLMGMGMLMLCTGGAFADDGTIFRKNVSSTPDLETEFAAIRMLPLYVPAQNSGGFLLTEPFIEYLNAEGAVAETQQYARPLITHYTDGHVEGIDEEGYGGFPGHGKRDAFGAVSLDDGATWKRTNLSKSADLSSFKIKDGKKWVPYPGDVGRTFAASDGNKVLIAWVSRYCGGGSPNYAMIDPEREALATYMGDTDYTDENETTISLYLDPLLFGVPGSQGSSDLADEGFPLIGELPYACVWTARGVINPPVDDTSSSTITWFKAERLTSGVRDANRPEAVCVKGAGCVVTWQEDPEGIRPGEGEGPGEGWSGAIAHHQTDIWYSYISWNNFDLADDGDGFYGTPISLAEYTFDTAPQVGVPMSMPVRLSDNAMCVMPDADGNSDDPYCYADFDESGTADFCASWVTITIETPEGGAQDVNMCVAEDGRLMRGNTAATRARLGLHGYSSTCSYDPLIPDACPIDSAWFSMAYEENKGLGEDGEDLVVVEKIDMGKNVWYHTFDMSDPEVVSQGLMLNQPAVYPDDFTAVGDLIQDTSLGYNFYQIYPDPVYETLAGIKNDNLVLYQSEIARRPSPISQDWYDAGESGTVAFQLWKQGIIRRGGPADIMGRRFVIPDDFVATEDNPYDYANMACENADGSSGWAFTYVSNPRYVKGLCAAPAVNLSGNTILTGECGDATTCLDAFPFNEYFDDYQGGEGGTPAEGISKIWTWQQFGPNYGETVTYTAFTNFDDVSWENPYDVAKGHRGFMSGDMIMAIYAWSPNWLANTVGHDNYNLYARRSFDGGQTWTTTPAEWNPEGLETITWTADGTTTCEWMEPEACSTATVSGECPVCVTYAAGEFEQTRNLSQLVGTQTTILDPRYSPTTRSITADSVSTASLPAGFNAPLYLDDTRDPSRFFIVYETGDNTTVAFGEAEPLDLFSSRAVNWGDDYLVWQDTADTSACLPSASEDGVTDPLDGSGFCNEFEPLEGSALSESGEASITVSPGGQYFYAVWNQVDFDKTGKEIGSDAWFRRVLFLDGVTSDPDGDGGGDGGVPPVTPPGQAKKTK